MKQLWAIAGPNGSGKSTFARRHFMGKVVIVNPDDIAAEEGVSALSAGRMTLARQQDLLAQGKSFAFETTLSGRHELRVMELAKQAGYKVNLIFFSVSSPELSVGRVALRVQAGGHDVPAADILRRYGRSIAQLPAALAVAHRAYVLDNSGPRSRLLLSLEAGQVKRITKVLPEWARPVLAPYLALARSREISR